MKLVPLAFAVPLLSTCSGHNDSSAPQGFALDGPSPLVAQTERSCVRALKNAPLVRVMNLPLAEYQARSSLSDFGADLWWAKGSIPGNPTVSLSCEVDHSGKITDLELNGDTISAN
ncbi:hypothetical protein [Sphingomonas sp.]|uniref:hypothetical protein n=1 Tax=Sphingomonas sp. TaxID=28214 RepID=UPI003CC58A36